MIKSKSRILFFLIEKKNMVIFNYFLRKFDPKWAENATFTKSLNFTP